MKNIQSLKNELLQSLTRKFFQVFLNSWPSNLFLWESHRWIPLLSIAVESKWIISLVFCTFVDISGNLVTALWNMPLLLYSSLKYSFIICFQILASWCPPSIITFSSSSSKMKDSCIIQCLRLLAINLSSGIITPPTWTEKCLPVIGRKKYLAYVE